MKKLVSVILVICICFGMFIITDVSATGTADVAMGTASGNVGDTVAVDLTLNANPGFGTLGVNVDFDRTKLQLVSVTNKKVFTNGDSEHPYTNTAKDSTINTTQPYLIAWSDALTLTNTTETGKLATFNFKILSGATPGQTPVTISIKNCFQADLAMTTVPTTITSGYVTVPYTVTFDSTGGSVVPNMTGTTSIAKPANPTKTGYTFNGWFAYATGGTAITFPYTVTANTTLYAQWTIANYAVTFNSNGGTSVNGTTTDYNTTIVAPADPTKTGYTFAGWYADSALTTAWNFTTSKVTAATTIYAKWTANNYTVAFDSNGGSSVASIKADYNTTIAAPTAPTKSGFGFAGWYTAATGGTAVVFPYTVTADTTMFAHWADKTWNVTFNVNGGSAIATVPVVNNFVVAKPADPTKTGYIFAGWYKDTAFVTTWNFTTDTITADTTLFAKWTAISYAVTFNSNGGSAVAGVVADYNTIITAPAVPTKTGYTFNGWYKEAAFTTAWNFATNKVTAATTLFAKWTINTYTVTFNSNGGSAVANVAANYSTTIAKPADPTKTGYTFEGWYKDAAFTTAYNFATDTITADITLFAKWTAINYTVAFNSNGGSAVANVTTTYNTTITAPTAPSKTGYTFGGWFINSALTTAFNFTTDTITANTTLFAKWTVNSYTVTFNSNGGSAVANVFANYNTTIAAPIAPTKAGYTFAGWYKDAALATAWNFTTDLITADTTIYARWTPNNYTITFNSNGGSAVTSVIANYNTTIAAPTDPTKAGYTFNGWFSAATGGTAITFPYNVTSATTLYAQWAAITYTVAFNSNGGSAVASKTGIINTTINVPTTPTKTGYTFKGWFATETGGTAITFPYTITNNVTLFAQWTALIYGVHFNSNGGIFVEGIVASYNTTIMEPVVPTKLGYTFSGWYKDTMLTVPWAFNTDVVTGNTNLYAKWTPISCTITFNSNGGSAVGSINADYDSKFTAPIDPTKNGFIFGGWYKEPIFSNVWDFDSETVAGVTTLYAKWNIDLTPGTQQQWIKDGIAWNYTPLGSNFCRIDSCGPAVGALVIPETINGRAVYSIGNSAFRGNTELTGITLPNSVVVIEPNAFENCTALVNVTFGNSLTTIGSYAFNSCTALTCLNLPDSTISIGAYSFKGCTGLTSLLIPENVYEINAGAFSGCTGLKKVTIGSSVNDIESDAFSGCTNLVSACLLGDMPLDFASNTFFNCSPSFKIYYIEGKIDPIVFGFFSYSFSTFIPLVGSPTGFTANSISATTVTLSWTPVVGATGYEIYLGSTKISSSTIYGTTYTVTGLLKNTTYLYTIKAINNITESPLSEPLSVTTKGIAGDVNDDGLVNLMDVTLLSRNVAGWTVQVQESALDVSGDGSVNLIDVTLLSRYVAGWNVVIY